MTHLCDNYKSQEVDLNNVLSLQCFQKIIFEFILKYQNIGDESEIVFFFFN